MKTKKYLKKNNLMTICAVFVLFVFCMGVAALSVDYGPITVTIDATTKATDRYLPVNLKHQYHAQTLEISCTDCHHTEIKGFSGSPPRCESCHKGDSKISLKDAMHRNCVICHINKIAEGKKAAPNECLECHSERK